MKYTEHNEKVMQNFADMMIERMEQMKAADWQKGWIGTAFNEGPVNISGNSYAGVNTFLLLLHSGMKGYDYPIYCTVRQANKMGAHVNKGEKSMPVIFWDRIVKDENGRTIRYESYQQMSAAEQQRCEVYPVLKSYSVFNIAQTNLSEVASDKLETLKKRFSTEEMPTDTKGMFESKEMDAMLENQTWVCPISYKKRSDSAYFSPSEDKIVVPTKAQFRRGKSKEDVFKDGQEFYSTIIHEMIHSTGTKERLGRENGKRFGDDMYAREELVAELGAARIGQLLGFDKRILNNNAAYLDGWISALKKEPKFILTLLTDVDKAAKMVTECLCAPVATEKALEPTHHQKMMKQFRELKEKHSDAVLLFRTGDFYEAYEEDAVKCAQALGITLTKVEDDRLAGFPHHALDVYLPKLIRAGYRVAICDELNQSKKLQ